MLTSFVPPCHIVVVEKSVRLTIAITQRPLCKIASSLQQMLYRKCCAVKLVFIKKLLLEDKWRSIIFRHEMLWREKYILSRFTFFPQRYASYGCINCLFSKKSVGWWKCSVRHVKCSTANLAKQLCSKRGTFFHRFQENEHSWFQLSCSQSAHLNS